MAGPDLSSYGEPADPDAGAGTEPIPVKRDDGRYYLVPTIVDGKKLSDDDAALAYHDGKLDHVGIYAREDAAVEAAKRLKDAKPDLSKYGERPGIIDRFKGALKDTLTAATESERELPKDEPAPATPAARADLPDPFAKPFDPTTNTGDAVALDLMSKKAREDDQRLQGPARVGPTREAADALARQDVETQADAAAPDIKRAKAAAAAVSSFTDMDSWTETHPLQSSISGGLAHGLSGLGDFAWAQAEEAQRKVDEGKNPVAPDEFWARKAAEGTPGASAMLGLSAAGGVLQEGLRQLLFNDKKGAPERLKWAESLDEASNLLKPQLTKLNVDEAVASHQLLKWLVVQEGQQAPNHAMLVATMLAPSIAPLTIPVMAGQSGGQQYAENRAANVPHDQAYLDALANFSAEGGGEAFEAATGFVGGKAILKVLRGIPIANREAAATAIMARALKSTGILAGGSATGAAGEAATQYAQDTSQEYFTGRDAGDKAANARTAAAIGAFGQGVSTVAHAGGRAIMEAGAAPTTPEGIIAKVLNDAKLELRPGAADLAATRALDPHQAQMDGSVHAVLAAEDVSTAIAEAERALIIPTPPHVYEPDLQGQAQPDDADLRMPAAAETAPAIEIPGAPAAPTSIPPMGPDTRAQYADAAIKQDRGELLTAYEKALLASPPETSPIVRTDVEAGRGARDPQAMTQRELEQAAKLTRSPERRSQLEAEINRRTTPETSNGNPENAAEVPAQSPGQRAPNDAGNGQLPQPAQAVAGGGTSTEDAGNHQRPAPEEVATTGGTIPQVEAAYRAAGQDRVTASVSAQQMSKLANDQGVAQTLWKSPAGELQVMPATSPTPAAGSVPMLTVNPNQALSAPIAVTPAPRAAAASAAAKPVVQRASSEAGTQATPDGEQRGTTPAPAVAAPTAPDFRDYTEPRTDRGRGVKKGELREWKTQKLADAFVKAQKLRGYTAPQVEGGAWRLSRPPLTQKQIDAQARLAREGKQVRPHDSLGTMLRKWGGAKTSDFTRDGADPEDIRKYRPFSFVNEGGLSLGDLAELMAAQGFDVYDEHGAVDDSKARDLIQQEIEGTPVYTAEGHEIRIAQAEERRAKGMEPTPQELGEADLEEADSEHVSMLAQLAMADEGRLDALAVQFTDDEAGFLHAVEEFVDDQDHEAAAGSETRAEAPAREESHAPAEEVSKATALKRVAAAAEALRAAGTGDITQHVQAFDLARKAAENAGATPREIVGAMEAPQAPMRIEDTAKMLEAGKRLMGEVEKGASPPSKPSVESEALAESPPHEAHDVTPANETPATAGVSASGPATSPHPMAAAAEALHKAADALVQATTPTATPSLALTGETEAEIRTREAREAAAEKEKQQQAAAPSADDFSLTGSNRPVDVARAHGQLELGGVPVAEAEAIARQITASWKNAPDVVVVNSMDDEKVPIEVREDDAAQRAQGAEGQPAAFFYGGKVYLVASESHTPNDVVTYLFHEALGHYGLRGIFGDQLDSILRSVASARRTEVEAKAEQYGLDINDPEDMLTAAEEVLAELAQSRPEISFVRRAIAALRGYLRSLGLNLELTDDEILHNFILPARGFVERGQGDTAGAARFARSAPFEPIFYSDLSRQLAGVKTESAGPDQWKSTIKNLKGVKADEIQWSGVLDWLATKTGKVTKAEVQGFLAQNGVKVEEKMLGGEATSGTRAIGDATVRLTSMGFEPIESGDYIAGIRRVRDGKTFAVNEETGALGWGDVMTPENVGRAVFDVATELLDARVGWVDATTDADRTRFAQYTLPGGENYRELLLTLPEHRSQQKFDPSKVEIKRDSRSVTQGSTSIIYDGKTLASYGDDPQLQPGGGYKQKSEAHWMEVAKRVFENGDPRNSIESLSGNFRSSHFDAPNILAHIRFKDRTDAEGKKVLFIEEFQSDWAQRGKREGFQEDLPARVRELSDKRDRMIANGETADVWRINAELQELGHRPTTTGSVGVPSAPFVGKTEAWVALAVKRMIRYAAEHGYDRVAWTNGEQQAARYDLSKHVDAITYRNVDDGKWAVVAWKDGHPLDVNRHADEYDAKQLEAMFGKDVADKIVQDEGHAPTMRAYNPDGDRKELSGLDLKVGGEGMKAFYDKIVPNVVNDVLKKMGGGRVSEVKFPPNNAGFRLTRDGRANMDEPSIGTQPGFDITHQMRETAMGGMPMFARRLVRGERRTKNDFVLPDTPEYASNTTGDLARITPAAAASHPRIEALPVRLPVGVASAAHKGFGIEHLRAEADRVARRRPRQHTNDLAENFARDVADIARNGDKLFYDEKNDRVVLANRSGFGIVLQAHEAGGDRYYSVVTMFKPDNEMKQWGRPVWVGRGTSPTTESPSSGAPELSPGPNSGGPDRLSHGGQTEPFKFYPNEGNGGEGPGGPRFARTGGNQRQVVRGTGTWAAPIESRLDDITYRLQDKHIDTKRVISAISQAQRAIADDQDPYLQEELFHGRAAKAVDDFLNDELKPLMKDMAARNVGIADFEEWLHARHAQERNAQIAAINPNLPDGGSGMTNAEAAQILAQARTSGKDTAYRALAQRVDAISAKTRQAMIDYKLEEPAAIAAWKKAYQNYVPLQREDMEGGMGIGQGFSVRSGQKRATGSQRAVVDILANVAMQRERTIARGEKAVVGRALLGLAIANPNPDFWRVDQPAMVSRVDPRTGQVVQAVDPLYKSRENVFMVRTVYPATGAVDHAVVFNEHDPLAMRMAQALKNLDANEMGVLLTTAAKFTRYFASINTQYNPVFGFVNLTRDIQEGMLNLSSTPLAGAQKEVAKNALSALRGIYIDLRDHRNGVVPSSSWAQLFEEFQKAGGQTGYRDLFRTSDERTKALEREIKKARSAGARSLPRSAWDWAFDWLSDYNETMENAVRLAAYKVGRDRGLSKDRAASLAKNLTVNFNRKGQITTQAGSLYAFFNANVQGTARNWQTLVGPAGKKIIAGGVMLGVLQAIALEMAGFDDDEPPEFVREKNLIIPIGGKKYVTIPMPLGFSVIPNIGRIPTEFLLRGMRNPGRRLSDFFGVLADAYSPLGSSGVSMQTIAPTILDPFAALAENKDWTGRPIARVDTDALHPTPGHTRAKDVASTPAKMLARAVNWATGGTKYKPGAVSPTPDQIDYLLGQFTGGVGREGSKVNQTISSLITGEELPPHKIPLVGRLYGDAASATSHANTFYDNVKEINEHAAELRGRRKNGEPIGNYYLDNPEAKLVGYTQAVERQVAAMRKEKRTLVEKDAPREQIKAVEDRIGQRMLQFNTIVKKTREAPAEAMP